MNPRWRLTETPYKRSAPRLLQSGAPLQSYSFRLSRLLITQLRFRSLGEGDVCTRVQHGSTAGADLPVAFLEFA
jgi:hypothetical protein